jgi:hypothetical protein
MAMADKVLILVLGFGTMLLSCAEQSHLLLNPDGTVKAYPAGRQADPIYRETEIRLSRPRLNGEIFDPQETDPLLKGQFAIADRKAELAVKDIDRDLGFIFQFWDAKQRILRDQFGIHWNTPAELNPSIVYANYGQPNITDAENRALRTLAIPLLSSSSEQMRGVTRSFEGIASVWTRDTQTEQIREYRFTGHDDSWTFIEVSKWEE